MKYKELEEGRKGPEGGHFFSLREPFMTRVTKMSEARKKGRSDDTILHLAGQLCDVFDKMEKILRPDKEDPTGD